MRSPRHTCLHCGYPARKDSCFCSNLCEHQYERRRVCTGPRVSVETAELISGRVFGDCQYRTPNLQNSA